MARIRTIKPDFWRNEALSSVSAEAALLAIGLLNFADDEGYFRANPRLLQCEVFPLRELYGSTHLMVDELESIGYIEVKTGSDGTKIGRVVNFDKHQVVNKKTPSKLKGLLGITEDYRSDTVGLPTGKGKGKGKGKGINKGETTPNENLETEKNQTPAKLARFDPLKVELPECIKPAKWDEWIVYRKKRKLTNNEQTIQKQLRDLETWYNAGHDPNDIIEKSIAAGWQGLFEPKGNSANKVLNGKPQHEQKAAVLLNALKGL